MKIIYILNQNNKSQILTILHEIQTLFFHVCQHVTGFDRMSHRDNINISELHLTQT